MTCNHFDDAAESHAVLYGSLYVFRFIGLVLKPHVVVNMDNICVNTELPPAFWITILDLKFF